MNAFIDFSSSWYVLLFGFLAAWAVLIVARKKITRHEIKEQMLLALGGMTAMVLMELFAVSTGLWSYTPGNWPVILWPTYFSGILFGYQLLRVVEGFLFRSRTPLMAPQ